MPAIIFRAVVGFRVVFSLSLFGLQGSTGVRSKFRLGCAWPAEKLSPSGGRDQMTFSWRFGRDSKEFPPLLFKHNSTLPFGSSLGPQ